MLLFLVGCSQRAEVPVAVEVQPEEVTETGNPPLDITLAPGIFMHQLGIGIK